MIEETTTVEAEKPEVTFKILDNSKRAKNAMIILWLLMGLTIIATFSDYAQLLLLEQIQEEIYVDEIAIDMNDFRQMAIGILQSILHITSAIVFLYWFRRVYGNLKRLNINTQFGETMAVWAWIIPILNLFRPLQIMNEIWNKTQNSIKKLNPNYLIVNGTVVIGIWWGLHIINNYVGRYAMKSAFKEDTIEQLIISTKAYMISDLLEIPEALLIIFIISRISKMETKLATEIKELGGVVLSNKHQLTNYSKLNTQNSQ